MRFRKHRLELYANFPNNLDSSSHIGEWKSNIWEKIHRKSPGCIDWSFDNIAESFPPTTQKVFAEQPRFHFRKTCSIWNNNLDKTLTRNVEWGVDKTAKTILPQIRIISINRHRKVEKRKIFAEKYFFHKNWHRRPEHLSQNPTLSEKTSKFWKKRLFPQIFPLALYNVISTTLPNCFRH